MWKREYIYFHANSYRLSVWQLNSNSNKMCLMPSIYELDRPGNTVLKTVETVKSNSMVTMRYDKIS